MGEQLTPRMFLVFGFVLGIDVSFLSAKAVERFFGRDKTPRQLTADLSLDDTHREMRIPNPPVSGTLHAGLRYTISMKKGSYTYMSFTTIIPSERLEAISEAIKAP